MPAKSTLTVCTVEGCDRPFYARGWCKAHYLRWHNTGDVQAAIPLRIIGDDVARFWAKVGRPNANGCREWTGQRVKDQYGMFKRGGKNTGAHRVAYELANGPIADGLHICHICDNPPCCEPSHLFTCTDAENARDRDAKGRGNKGRALRRR